MASHLHFDVHPGTGPLLLLVHGMLSSRAQWGPNLEALSEVGRPVTVELYGHGRSPSPDDAASYSPDAYVRAFEAIRELLGAERWLVCGQSLGAALTLRYSMVHPERVIAQVFTNSNSALAAPEWGERIREAAATQAPAIEAGGRAALEQMPIHPVHAKSLPEHARKALLEDALLHDPAGVARTLRYTTPDSSVRALVKDNRVPTLLVVGARERRFESQRRWAETHMPRLEVAEVAAGHAVNLEAAEGFEAAARAFLRRQPAH